MALRTKKRTPASVGTAAGKATIFVDSTDNKLKIKDEDGTVSTAGDGSGGGAVASVAGKTGAVTLTKSDVGLSQVDNTSDTAKPVSTAQQTAIDSAKIRGNHSGTQTSATISDFSEAVQDAVAALLGAGSNITLNYDDAANTLTIVAANSITDPEAVRDAIGVALVGIGNISIAVNDVADTITISTTATANSTDAQLRDRGTHTGVQAPTTITNDSTHRWITDAQLALLAAALQPSAIVNNLNTNDTTKIVSSAQIKLLKDQADANTRALSGSVQPLFSPANIPGLQGWFDVSKGVYTTGYGKVCDTLGDLVAIWPDSGNYVRDVTATSNWPTYDPTGFNGKPCVVFNGTNNKMSKANFFDIVAAGHENDYAGGGALIMAGYTDTGVATLTVAVSDENNYYLSKTGSTGAMAATFPAGVTRTGGAGAILGATSAHIQAMKYDQSQSKLWIDVIDLLADQGINGRKSTNTTGTVVASGSMQSGVATHNLVFGCKTNNFWFKGGISEVLIYSIPPTDEQFRQIKEYLAAKWGFTKAQVMIEGDSLEAGQGTISGANQPVSLTGDNVPSYLLQAGQTAPIPFKVQISAYSGRQADAALLEMPLYTNVWAMPNARKEVFIMDIGTNDLGFTKSSGATLDRRLRIAKSQKLLGKKVIGLPIMPRSNDASLWNLKGRQFIDAYDKAHYLEYMDGYVDLYAIPQLMDNTNLTFYDPDGIHLTSAGAFIKAQAILAEINRVLALP